MVLKKNISAIYVNKEFEMDINIKNISPETVKKIDELAKKETISRNAILIKIIEMYVACNEKVLSKYLPSIIRSLVTDELERLEIGSNSAINNIYLSSKKMFETANKIDNILAPTLEKEAQNSEEFSDILDVLKGNDTIY